MEHTLENLTNALIEHLGLHHNSKPAWEIKISETSGRGIYATRDILSHDVILTDLPLIVVPRFEAGCVICVQCCKQIDSEVICANGCKLPICVECQSASEHRDECNMITKWCPKLGDKIAWRIFRSLCLVRALLLKENRLALINMMQANRCPTQQTEIAEFISEFDLFPVDNNILQFIIHTSAAMNTNSFHARLNGMELRGLYPLAAMLNHSCAPNTRYTFSNDRVMCVRAIRPIRCGDEITISYCNVMTSTPMRQLLLRQTKKFNCTCARCSDRTEFGTNLTALKCIDDNCTGLLLPDDPLNLATTWTCTECGAIHQAKKMFMLDKMISNFLRSRASDHHAALAYCRDTLASNLPATNQLAIEFKNNLIDCIDESAKWSIIDLQDKETFCLEILTVLDKLGMRESVKAGKLYFELYKCRNEMYKRGGCTKTQQDENELLLQHSWKILHDDVTAPVDLVARIKQQNNCIVD